MFNVLRNVKKKALYQLRARISHLSYRLEYGKGDLVYIEEYVLFQTHP